MWASRSASANPSSVRAPGQQGVGIAAPVFRKPSRLLQVGLEGKGVLDQGGHSLPLILPAPEGVPPLCDQPSVVPVQPIVPIEATERLAKRCGLRRVEGMESLLAGLPIQGPGESLEVLTVVVEQRRIDGCRDAPECSFGTRHVTGRQGGGFPRALSR